jgi:hypothetical protein
MKNIFEDQLKIEIWYRLAGIGRPNMEFYD